MRVLAVPVLALATVLLGSSCAVEAPPDGEAPTVIADKPTVIAQQPGAAGARPKPGSDPNEKGLLLAMVVARRNPQGGVQTLPARLGILYREHGLWRYEVINDPDSNVFHKAMVYAPPSGPPGILTIGGTRAILKLWRRDLATVVLWEAQFGGNFSRMRDVEVGDLYGDGVASLVVATHDQGVVAVVRPRAGGGYEVEELDREPNTFVHEVEIGDLDGDGVLEVYATRSRPNKVDGTAQPGQVVRYVPATREKRTVVVDLGDRHAKEILVDDLDGDGRDELYVVVEAVSGGRVEIRRYYHGTDTAKGKTIAVLPDAMCRFLTTGDLEGDGRKEMVAAATSSGVWLLRPPAAAGAQWSVEGIDQNSSGFEHAAVLTDLDGDGRDELYVANDRGLEVNQYAWRAGGLKKTTIHTIEDDSYHRITWNIMPVPVAVIP